MQAQRLRVLVSGDVQGVGFRDWTRRRARTLGLAGTATNLPDGRVEIVVEGTRGALDGLLRDLSRDTPGRVDHLESGWSGAEGLAGFRIG